MLFLDDTVQVDLLVYSATCDKEVSMALCGTDCVLQLV